MSHLIEHRKIRNVPIRNVLLSPTPLPPPSPMPMPMPLPPPPPPTIIKAATLSHLLILSALIDADKLLLNKVMTKRKFQTDLFRLQCQTKIRKSRHTHTHLDNNSYVLFNALTIYTSNNFNIIRLDHFSQLWKFG